MLCEKLEMDIELYKETANILKKSQDKKAALKTLIYASTYKNIRQLFALVNECSKHKNILDQVLSQCCHKAVIRDLAEGNPELAVVFLYEFLLGRKFGRNVALRRQVQDFRGTISAAVEKVLQKHQAKSLLQASLNIANKPSSIPRYMRVNLMKSCVVDVVEDLTEEGWDFVGRIQLEEFANTVKTLDRWQFGQDPLLFDLLVFPAGTDLHDHTLTRSGVLIQQDRASCVPAHVLSPPRGSVILDCCAAPGNKTSHVASLIGDSGRVIALDRDSKRMKVMSRLLEISGASCVEMIVQDFLSVQPDSDDAMNVEFILVDPSCSGSGMISSWHDETDSRADSSRLETLKKFQISLLKHALRFPSARRVVYSTCSIHPEENEQVVEEVMGQVSHVFQFQPVLPDWLHSRGLDGYAHREFFLRLTPEKDLTQGFFVACFERIALRQHKESEISSDKIHQQEEEKNTQDEKRTSKKIKNKLKTKLRPD